MINDFKRRLGAGEVCVGAWVQSPDIQVAEAMLSCGFDWMAIDMEQRNARRRPRASAFFLAAER